MGRGQPLFLLHLRRADRLLRFFYTAVVFNPDDVAENLKKQGGFVPGIRPGKKHGRLSRLRR
jgi:preprotein translocase subunit SecY